MQSGVSVNGIGTITGTLKYVDDYTGFSGDTSLQSGHYLALKATVDDGSTLTVKIGERGPVDMSSDKFLVVRLTADDLEDKLIFTATKSGKTETLEYDLSELILEPEED